MATEKGLEPSTSGVTGRRSNQLNHSATAPLIYQIKPDLSTPFFGFLKKSFPVDTMDNPNTLRAFISTDVSLSSEEILNVYVNRWAIEVFFRDCKTKLAFDGYQIRSRKGIRRFWIITSLAYFVACSQLKSFHFSEGFSLLSHSIHREQILYIYNFGKSGQDISGLFSMLVS